MTTPLSEQLEQLQKDCGIPHLPTALTYDLRLAPSGLGPRAYDWQDKPHRLLYEACAEIERLTALRRPIPADVASVVERFVSDVTQDVSELPDYQSPDDQPDLLQCTVEELGIILEHQAATLLTTLASGREDAWLPIETAPRDGRTLLFKHRDGHIGIGSLNDVSFDNIDLKIDSAAWAGQTAYGNRSGVWIETNGPFNAVEWLPTPPTGEA